MRFFWNLRRSLRLYWYRADWGGWVFFSVLGVMIALLGFAMKAAIAHLEDRRLREIEAHRKNLECLARNVYYEARGEPVAGQYAVAEVTMNRWASPHYPDTVCEVVYQKNWDSIRKRYVGAFSWTEFDVLPPPDGEAWQRAQDIAEEVYYGRVPAQLEGALHFHATYIKPGWANAKERVTRIGRHVFYR